MIETIDKATIAATPELREKLINIKAIQDCRNDPALLHAVGEHEHVGEHVVPLDIGVLLHVDVHEEPQEDQRKSSLKKFVKQETVFNKIEGLGHVHTAPKDI